MKAHSLRPQHRIPSQQQTQRPSKTAGINPLMVLKGIDDTLPEEGMRFLVSTFSALEKPIEGVLDFLEAFTKKVVLKEPKYENARENMLVIIQCLIKIINDDAPEPPTQVQSDILNSKLATTLNALTPGESNRIESILLENSTILEDKICETLFQKAKDTPINVATLVDSISLGVDPEDLLKQPDMQNWVQHNPVVLKAVQKREPFSVADIHELCDSMRQLTDPPL